MRTWILLIGLLWTLLSCKDNRLFEDYQPIDRKGWHQDSAMVFTFHLEHTYSRYNIYLNVRNQGNYAWQNLWLSLETRLPDGQVKTDTVALTLAGPQGDWLGSGIGDLFDYRMLYAKQTYFPQPGTYQVFIRHKMRPEYLKGIHDVGMRIERGY